MQECWALAFCLRRLSVATFYLSIAQSGAAIVIVQHATRAPTSLNWSGAPCSNAPSFFCKRKSPNASPPIQARVRTTADLETKLLDFQHYYNGPRTHAGLEGRLPEPTVDGSVTPIALDSYQWRRHCRGLYQTPVAA